MKITRISLTGADDSTSIGDLIDLSRDYPIVEWAILMSEKRAGNGRYPSPHFFESLARAQNTKIGKEKPMNLAAHLCGNTMRRFMVEITENGYTNGAWTHPFSLTESLYNTTFQRTQVNFNAAREGFTPETMTAMLAGWYETMDGHLITQHNANNEKVWQWCQAYEASHFSVVRAHEILHDASGGRGTFSQNWNPPVAGLLNGYAGGLGPDNIVQTLLDNEQVIGNGTIWIDMENSLRDDNDRFDLNKAEAVLAAVTTAGKERDWIF